MKKGYYAVYHDMASFEIVTAEEYESWEDLSGDEVPCYKNDMQFFKTLGEAKAMIRMHLRGDIDDSRASLNNLNKMKKGDI